jgi:membrane protein YqaA with SNARE-associated domain
MNGGGLGGGLGLTLGLFGGGLASGLVPVVNAEALLGAAVAGEPAAWMLLVLGMTSGQSVAKVLIYLTARDGSERLGRLHLVAPRLTRVGGRTPCSAAGRRKTPPVLRAAWAWSLCHLRTPVAGTAVVTMSALVGLPPLVVVSGMAGMARLRLALFVPACFAGRLARFALIAWPIAHFVEQAAPAR